MFAVGKLSHRAFDFEPGRRMMYERGLQLRKKYVDELGFISPAYQSTEIYVRASRTARAQQTAQMLMVGLYPPGTAADPSKFNAALTGAPAGKATRR